MSENMVNVTREIDVPVPKVKLVRYGVEWVGPTEPICVEKDDGYWTPWHVAEAVIQSYHRLAVDLQEQNKALKRKRRKK